MGEITIRQRQVTRLQFGLSKIARPAVISYLGK